MNGDFADHIHSTCQLFYHLNYASASSAHIISNHSLSIMPLPKVNIKQQPAVLTVKNGFEAQGLNFSQYYSLEILNAKDKPKRRQA